MIHSLVIQDGTCVDACLNGAAIKFLIIEFHLAGGIQDGLWPMLCPFHITYTILKGGRNNRYMSSFWIAVRRIGCSKLGHKLIAHGLRSFFYWRQRSVSSTARRYFTALQVEVQLSDAAARTMHKSRRRV